MGKYLPGGALPLTVFSIGVLSIALVFWGERVSERLRRDETLVDTVMDVRIKISTYHLRVEESLAGDVSGDVKKELASIDQAITLINRSLVGGEVENRRIVKPFQEPELRSRAEKIRILLWKLKVYGLERLRRNAEPGSAAPLADDFHALYKEAHRNLEEMETLLEKNEDANQEKSRRLFAGILAVWSTIVIAATGGLWSRERKRRCAEDALRLTNLLLLSQTEELKEHREHLAELVEQRTQDLTAANEQIRVEMAERQLACEILDKKEHLIGELSTVLLTAQEAERKRIAMELHDELGQALTALKFRVRIMERGLGADQGTIRNGCEELLGDLDQVIEEVRRLSLDLSPTVLEELGLTSALHWLISSFSQVSGIAVNSEIADSEHLFSRHQWITIYRILQEALTNIGKHAQAGKVSVSLSHSGHEAVFSVEDDGKGFDPESAPRKDGSLHGLGLATMSGRTQQMGGNFELWSEEGKGTRITVSIPVGKGVA